MKNKLLLSLLFLSLLFPVYAADDVLKIGYVNLDYVVNMLPESQRVEADLKAFELQLRKQLEGKAGEFEQKYQSFQKEQPNMTAAVKNQKEQELQQFHSQIEQLRLESQNSIIDKQLALVKPIYEKVQKIIEAVAKENKYTHVFNSNAGGMAIMLYGQEQYDLSDVVLKRLGVDPKAVQKEESKTAQKPSTSKGKEVTKKEQPKRR
jgi:outer membrane protein